MLSLAKVQWICSLHHKKGREKHKMFIVEGLKNKEVFEQKENKKHKKVLSVGIENRGYDVDIEVPELQMKKISTMVNPPGILAVYETCENSNLDKYDKGKHLLLDQLSDPGNVGTLIRTAYWFGYDGVIFSENVVELYNPKVVQASMGAIALMPIYHEKISELKSKIEIPLLIADMDGSSVYDIERDKENKSFVIAVGKESEGISHDLLQLNHNKVSIPFFQINKTPLESLNVSISGAILMALFNQ